MIDKVSDLAERLATNVSLSRRGFFGRLGKGALVAAGVVAGVLAFPKQARAGGSFTTCMHGCCQGSCGAGDKKCSCSTSAYTTCYFICTGPQ